MACRAGTWRDARRSTSSATGPRDCFLIAVSARGEPRGIVDRATQQVVQPLIGIRNAGPGDALNGEQQDRVGGAVGEPGAGPGADRADELPRPAFGVRRLAESGAHLPACRRLQLVVEVGEIVLAGEDTDGECTLPLRVDDRQGRGCRAQRDQDPRRGSLLARPITSGSTA